MSFSYNLNFQYFFCYFIVTIKNLLGQIFTLKKVLTFLLLLTITGFIFEDVLLEFLEDGILYTEIIDVDYKLSHSHNSTDEDHAACIIPQTPIVPLYFKKKWKNNVKNAQRKYSCSYENDLAVLSNDEKTLIMNPKFSHQSCCLQEIVRGKKDFKYSFTDCKEIIGNKTIVEDKEAFVVKCGDFLNVDTGIPTKQSVREKMNFWKNIPESERPMNVLLLGVDSVSRKHAFRSIPRTIQLMKAMGFVDFNSYQSIAPSTLTNFMGFLMGLPRSKVRELCAPKWSTPFDQCPLIWKDFDKKKYVTGYIEDGDQSFNWGGQGGFVKQPTDYNPHALFLGLEKLRKQQMTKIDPQTKKKYSLECTSTASIPQYILTYTQRLMQKFSNTNTPFFQFSWLAYPYHANIYALSLIDSDLVNFFKNIQANENLLRKTVIIFLSDHGDRTSFFNSKSFESFIERGLPPLFIRLPEDLLDKYPEMAGNLKFNSKYFTTPFDLHHTLLHLAFLSNRKKLNSKIKTNTNTSLTEELYKDFIPVLTDGSKSSLLIALDPNRTCVETNIPATRCLCNIEYTQANSVDLKMSKELTDKVFEFALSQLNLKISRSKYNVVCDIWKGNSTKNISYIRKLSQTSDSLTVLITISVLPGNAKFEVTLKVVFKSNPKDEVDHMELVGTARVNAYNDQSWCVGTATDDDKELKEYCYCKTKPQRLKG